MAFSAGQIEALRNPGCPVSGLKTYLISRSIFFPGPRSDFEIPIRIVDFLKHTLCTIPQAILDHFESTTIFPRNISLQKILRVDFTRKWKWTQNKINIIGGKSRLYFIDLPNVSMHIDKLLPSNWISVPAFSI